MARPLARKNEKGELYVRPPGIDAKIDVALGQDPDTMAKRALSNNPRFPDYLPSECLVHLIRDAIRRRDECLAAALMPPLVVRCEANLLKTVPDTGMRNAEAIREEILSSFGLMFAEDGTDGHEDELDYYECRFSSAFRTLRIDHVREEISRRQELTDLPDAINEEGERSSDEEMLARLSSAARIKGAQGDQIYLRQVLRVVNDLPPDQRRAVVLCRILGYEQESTDPTKRTAATICNVAGRTIRNRLSRAERQLKSMKEDL
jgi:hypothetical protein